MFHALADDWPPLPTPGNIDADEQLLLWAWRRLALLAPPGEARCHAVRAVLQRRFGEAGTGIEHGLACVLMLLAARGRRPLRFGTPCCPLLLDDEMRLILALRLARGGRAAVMLAPLLDRPAVAAAESLLAFLAGPLLTESNKDIS